MTCQYKDCKAKETKTATIQGKPFMKYCAMHYERVRSGLMLTQKREDAREVISMCLRERYKENPKWNGKTSKRYAVVSK